MAGPSALFYGVSRSLKPLECRTCYVRYFLLGCVIAQAVIRWFPTSADRVRARFRSCWICGGQSGTGACFLRVLRILLPVFIPPIAAQSFSIIWGWYNTPVAAAIRNVLSLN
jgi:hypothetical protein